MHDLDRPRDCRRTPQSSIKFRKSPVVFIQTTCHEITDAEADWADRVDAAHRELAVRSASISVQALGARQNDALPHTAKSSPSLIVILVSFHLIP